MTMTRPNSAGPAFLLTNDDGIDAPGIAALERAVLPLGRLVVVAPAGPWSGRGHAVTTDGPIRVVEAGPGRFAVDGTPADCVRLGLHHLCPDVAWVIAGINAGGNLGTDIHHSGTVAAAREAAIHGRAAVAVSHYIARGRAIDWDLAARRAQAVLGRLLGRVPAGGLWNVNLPHVGPEVELPEVVECPADPSPLPLRFECQGENALYRGDYQSRARIEGHDVALCFGGRISVSFLPLWPAPGNLAIPGGPSS